MSDVPVQLPDREPALRVVPMPADANYHGDIFGGWIMSQVDVAGSIPASRRARGRVATIAVNSFVFKQPVQIGDLVSFFARSRASGGRRSPSTSRSTPSATRPTRSPSRSPRRASPTSPSARTAARASCRRGVRVGRDGWCQLATTPARTPVARGIGLRSPLRRRVYWTMRSGRRCRKLTRHASQRKQSNNGAVPYQARHDNPP